MGQLILIVIILFFVIKYFGGLSKSLRRLAHFLNDLSNKIDKK